MNENVFTRTSMRLVATLLFLSLPMLGQGKRFWVLGASGEMTEYDPAMFQAKQSVKVPAEAAHSPQNVAINHAGQILFAPTASLPLAEGDAESAGKVWFWNGHSAAEIDLGVARSVSTTGSNQAVTESAPTVYLSADGAHLFWFGNQARRLQREGVDLSTTTTWQAWQTDTSGTSRADLATSKFSDCRCPSGSCEETCAYGAVWVPAEGAGKFFFMNEFIAGKTDPIYKASTLYLDEAGKWTAHPLTEPLRRVLDAASDGNVIVEAIPDTGCCGWSNQSDDQTVVRMTGKTLTVFDERVTYKNPDYDVSFFTSNAYLSPDLGSVAMTITATARADQSMQLSEEGQANPEESKQIRKALTDMPAIEVKSLEDTPRRIAFVPHATLIGWISEKEVLIFEDHLLIAYNVATGARRKSNIKVEDAAQVFLR